MRTAPADLTDAELTSSIYRLQARRGIDGRPPAVQARLTELVQANNERRCGRG